MSWGHHDNCHDGPAKKRSAGEAVSESPVSEKAVSGLADWFEASLLLELAELCRRVFRIGGISFRSLLSDLHLTASPANEPLAAFPCHL